MNINVFWNKAIEHYCIAGKPEGSSIFIPISENALEFIYSGFLKQIEYDDRIYIEKIVSKSGSINKSYYSALQNIHDLLNLPSHYPFLRFSIFTIVRFHGDNSNNGYWNFFDRFLSSKELKPLPANRTPYVQSLIKSVKAICRDNNVNFYCRNIYGDNAERINVGIIFAHAMFDANDIKEIKRTLYEEGIAYDTPIQYLNTDQIQLILEHAGLKRASAIFAQEDVSTKELIYECLKLWLENWEPKEEEEIELANTNTSRSKRSVINLSWVWILEKAKTNRQIKRKAGFIVRNSLGEEGKFALGHGSSIDLSKGYSINTKEYLYFIEDYKAQVPLFSSDLNKLFESPKEYQVERSVALRMVSSENHEPLYFYQETRQVIPFWDEKVFLVTNEEINALKDTRTPKFSIDQNAFIFLYRIRDDFSYNGISFKKSDTSANVTIKGVTAGIQGRKTFLKQFPVTLQLTNLYKGSLKVINLFDIITTEFNIEEETDSLHNTIQLPTLESGDYRIVIRINGSNIPIFNGQHQIEFAIMESGNGDSRKDFTNAPYRPLNPDFKWIVLDKESSLENQILGHQLFDFCFDKTLHNGWRFSLNRNLYFAYVLYKGIDESKLIDKTDRNYRNIQVTYIASPSQTFWFEIIASYDATFTACINSSLYIYRHFNSDKLLKLWLFCFELVDFESGLKERFPYIEKGNKIWVVTNYSSLTQPNELIKIISQKFFPFGRKGDYG